MSKSCSRGPRHCRNAANRKRKLKTDQVYLYLPSIKGGIIFSQVLAMEHLQQYELGAYVNLMEASTRLLVNPILGLQPKYTEQDFEKLCAFESELYRGYFMTHKSMILSMANLLYKIKLDEKDRKLLSKALKKNKEFLGLVKMSKKEFDDGDIAMVERALKHRYKFSTY